MHRLALAAIVLSATASRGATLFVANNGVDGTGCGGATAPCRTLGRALGLAVEGDTIEVGPGRYGTLDRTGTLADTAGEEVPATPCASCMVKVDRAVTIISRDGAGATGQARRCSTPAASPSRSSGSRRPV